MGKKDLLSNSQGKIRPYVRYNKDTDEIETGTYIEREITNEPSEASMETGRSTLDSIARVVAYMYMSEQKDYEQLCSSPELQRSHIFKDLVKIDKWLTQQYGGALNGESIETKGKSL